VCADKNGNIWVCNRGDYYNRLPKLYCIDSQLDLVTDSINIPVSNFHLDDEKLYIVSVAWNYTTMSNEINYGVVDVISKQIITHNFITDNKINEIRTPYGITVNPITKSIYVTDAKNHVTPGRLYCFDKDGKYEWDVRTGDIPAHFAFLEK